MKFKKRIKTGFLCLAVLGMILMCVWIMFSIFSKNYIPILLSFLFAAIVSIGFRYALKRVVPKGNIKFPVFQILFILLFLVSCISGVVWQNASQESVAEAYEVIHFSKYPKEAIVFAYEEESLRFEIQNRKHDFLFSVYGTEQKNKEYKLLKEWKQKKEKLWTANAEETEKLISDTWLSAKLSFHKLEKINQRTRQNYLIGVSKNQEVSNITIKNIPVFETVSFKISDGTYYIYFWKGQLHGAIEKADIKIQ